jgi:pseudaminic acid biosynthesis-associated methylase
VEKFETEQEEFWAGHFGDAYSDRNIGAGWIAANTALFAKIIDRTRGVKSVIEYGANIGLNLRAIHSLIPDVELTAVEINSQAAEALRDWGQCDVREQSILDFEPDRQWDIALVKGVLIHINPEALPRVYDLIYKSTRKFICIVEYFNPIPVAMPYRGHDDRLFKRDFAGEMLERFSDLELVDYGFCYRRDPNFPQDDVTWFLLKKN